MRRFKSSWLVIPRQILVARQIMIASGLMAIATTIGCGGSAPVAESTPANDSQTPAAATQSSTTQSPEAVVSEFLDGVRRGGDAENVARLMTKKSRDEYAAAGLVMQPVGAPDATFEVTRSVPYGDAGVLVNSLWTEKTETGETMTYQVGWALKQEPEGWRVSGLILDEDPEPRVFNFESREDVVLLKSLQDVDPAAGEPGVEGSAGEQTANQSNFQMPDMR